MKPKKYVRKSGTVVYMLGDDYHRVDGPAIEYSDGTKEWYQYGKLHREDGPAIEYPYGGQEWWLSVRHRLGGPAIENSYGEQWWVNGRLHREDGPAVVWSDGVREWYVNGKLHRENGPAREYSDGNNEWYNRGSRLRGLDINRFIYSKSHVFDPTNKDGYKLSVESLFLTHA